MDTRNWEAIEARFQCAKFAIREAQEQHCEAAQEFLQARAELRLMLEPFFPNPAAAIGQPRHLPSVIYALLGNYIPGINYPH